MQGAEFSYNARLSDDLRNRMTQIDLQTLAPRDFQFLRI